MRVEIKEKIQTALCNLISNSSVVFKEQDKRFWYFTLSNEDSTTIV